MKLWKIILLLVVLGVIGVLAYRAMNLQTLKIAKANGDESLPVKVATATDDTISLLIEGSGTLKGLHEAVITAETNGIVEKIHASVGDALRKGQPIVTLEHALKELTRDQAKVAADKAAADLKRIENLFAAGQASQSDLEMARLGNTSTQVGLSMAQRDLDNTTIRAPFAGTLTSRMTDLGMQVGPGAPVAELVDLAKLKLTIDVPEQAIVSLKEGTAVRIEIPSMPGDSLVGKIVSIGNKTAMMTGNFPVEIEVAQNGSLKSGMFAKASVLVSTEKQLVVPSGALTYVMNQPYMYIVNGARVRKQLVRLGIVQKTRLGVLSGIVSGDQVVTSGMDALSDGVAIRIVTNGNGGTGNVAH